MPSQSVSASGGLETRHDPDQPRSPIDQEGAPSFSSASGVNLGLVFGVVFVALIALLGGYSWKVSSDIARLNGEIAKAEAEKTRLAAVIAEGQRYKRKRSSRAA